MGFLASLNSSAINNSTPSFQTSSLSKPGKSTTIGSLATVNLSFLDKSSTEVISRNVNVLKDNSTNVLNENSLLQKTKPQFSNQPVEETKNKASGKAYPHNQILLINEKQKIVESGHITRSQLLDKSHQENQAQKAKEAEKNIGEAKKVDALEEKAKIAPKLENLFVQRQQDSAPIKFLSLSPKEQQQVKPEEFVNYNPDTNKLQYARNSPFQHLLGTIIKGENGEEFEIGENISDEELEKFRQLIYEHFVASGIIEAEKDEKDKDLDKHIVQQRQANNVNLGRPTEVNGKTQEAEKENEERIKAKFNEANYSSVTAKEVNAENAERKQKEEAIHANSVYVKDQYKRALNERLDSASIEGRVIKRHAGQI